MSMRVNRKPFCQPTRRVKRAKKEKKMSVKETTAEMPHLIHTVFDNDIPISSQKSFEEEDIEYRKCPLCQSAVKLFNVNFEERMLMCENTACEFPFGHEDLVFVKAGDELKLNIDTDSQSTGGRLTKATASSVISTSCWSEIEKLDTLNDLEDSQTFEAKALEPKEYMSQKHRKQKPEDAIDHYNESLRQIKELESRVAQCEPSVIITNEKFLDQLKGLKIRGKSNHKVVLKPEEIKFIQRGSEISESTSEIIFDIKTVEGTVNVNITEVKQQ